MVAALFGGAGVGAGAQAGQAGVPGSGADLAELVADVLGGPGGLDGVGVAQVQQPAVRHAAHVGAVGRAEGGQGLVPGGAHVGGGRGGFGADRVVGVVVAGQFPPGADGGGPFLPVEPVGRVGRGPGRARSTAQGGGCSAACSPIRCLRASISAAISVDVGAAAGVGDGGDLRGPRPGRERDQGAEAAAEPGVDDGGDVAGAGQVPFGDRVGEDLGGVQAGQFGGVQGPP